MTASTAVVVVPTLAPMTIAAAPVRGNIPPETAVRISAMAALEDCVSVVMIAPTRTRSSVSVTLAALHRLKSTPMDAS